MSPEELLLLSLSLVFGLTSTILLTLIKRFIPRFRFTVDSFLRFILSKPPGRRLVTSDVHILQASGTLEDWLVLKVFGHQNI